MKSLRIAMMAAVLAVPAAASAQDGVYRFRLAGMPGNIVGCVGLDSSFTRVHTLTIGNGAAELKSAGGINDTLKLAQPGIYRGTYELGGRRFEIEANTQAKNLIVSNRDTGCKWTAQAE